MSAQSGDEILYGRRGARALDASETDKRPMQRTAELLHETGFAYLPAPILPRLLGLSDAEWSAFASSWQRLGIDRFMADGGHYRRRRHAAFETWSGELIRKPHQPHFQSRDYNPLNGDVQRWFDPVEPEVGQGAALRSIFQLLTPLFTLLDGREVTAAWHSEVHQFRIETSGAELGRPTPEGLHRDGVDWVLVMLVARHNVEEGTTVIGTADNQPLSRFTLCKPGDAVLLDDRRIKHGVTPIRPCANSQNGYRDALVVTWSCG
jgi:hypothetical protein